MEIFDIEAINVVESYAYDDVSTGRVVCRDYDKEADGIVDDAGHFFWDGAGHVIRTEYDTGNDGTVDQAHDFDYDKSGNMVQQRWSIFDQGHLEFVTDFEWTDTK